MTDIVSESRKKEVHERLTKDFRYFCRKALVIRQKAGGIAPFILNKSQERLLEEIDRQLQDTGMVRIIIVKGRQQGISTLIAAWQYWRATRNANLNVFVLNNYIKHL